METGKLKLALSAGALALSMALAGCGGSSSGGTAQNPGPDPDPSCEDQGMLVGPNGDCETQAQRDERMRQAGRNAANNDALAEALYKAIDGADPAVGAADVGSVMRVKAFTDFTGDKASEKITPEGEPFNKEYPASTDGSPSTGEFTVVPSGNNKDFYAIDVASDTNTDLPLTNAKSDDFGKSSNPKTHNSDVQGTYHGVPGTFRCTSTDGCTSETDGSGAAAALVLTGDWFFKPTDPMARVVADATAQWGWWVQKVTDRVSDVHLLYTPLVTTLMRHTGGTAAGSATFEGKALGQYAFQGSSNDHGNFTADAKLTANFGSNDNAAGSDTLKGEITGFKVGADGEDRPWSVMLEQKSGSSTGDTDRFIFSAGTTVWDINGSAEGGTPLLESTKGEWNAQIYTDTTQDDSSPGAGNFPDVVLGGFSAERSDALMIGSFGAEHKP